MKIKPITAQNLVLLNLPVTWENVARSNAAAAPTWRCEANGIDVWLAHVKGVYRVSVAYGDGVDEIRDSVASALPHFAWVEARKQTDRGDKGALNALWFATHTPSAALLCLEQAVNHILSAGLQKSRSRRSEGPGRTEEDGWFLKKAEQIIHARDTRNPDAATRDALFIDSGPGNDLQIVERSAECRRLGLWWGDTGTWREHLIPVNRVLSEARRMAAEGRKRAHIAQFLKENLVVVIITNEEAKRLDGMPGLRDDMPEGWTWGGDKFARLEAAEIDY